MVRDAREGVIGRGWMRMKNTGKRIFAAALFVALANVPLMVLAGVHLSQR
jgi:hypothetical protein